MTVTPNPESRQRRWWARAKVVALGALPAVAFGAVVIAPSAATPITAAASVGALILPFVGRRPQ
jgi:hypothetical protein